MATGMNKHSDVTNGTALMCAMHVEIRRADRSTHDVHAR